MCSVHIHADVIRSDKVVDLRAVRIGSFIAISSQCKYKCYPGRLKTFWGIAWNFFIIFARINLKYHAATDRHHREWHRAGQVDAELPIARLIGIGRQPDHRQLPQPSGKGRQDAGTR